MVKKILLGVVALVVVAALGVGGFVFMKVSAFDDSIAKKWDIPLDEDFKAPDLSEVAGEERPAALFAEAPKDPPTAAETTSGEADDASGEADDAAADSDAESEGEHADESEDATADATALEEKRKLRLVWERGRHLSKSIGSCQGCHGMDLATPDPALVDMGPIGKLPPPNISVGGKLKEYSDPELHRLLVHGVKKDGTSLRFMAAQDFTWWPDEDIAALIGYLRTKPAVERPSGAVEVGTLGKILDQTDKMPIAVARRMDHDKRETAPEPAATAAYGAYLARLCQGCHGPGMSGGPLPGAPPDFPIPANITMHDTGIAHYDYEKFETLMRTAKKPDGSELDPFMPVRDLKHMDDVEMKALWLALKDAPPKAFGGR